MRLELGCHPTSELHILNKSEPYQKVHVHNRTTTRKDYKTSLANQVANLPQPCCNMPQPPQGCMANMPRLRMLRQDINPEDEATVVSSAADVIILDG